MARPMRFYSLRKPKIRQSWNKHNLFNIYRVAMGRPPFRDDHSYFQQKWKAKSASRAYHGEKVREHQWTRLFRRGLRSVVAVPPTLGRTDGSEHAAGRGAGLALAPTTAARGRRQRPPAPVPYMNMVYAPLERRLDTAVFRALFASSARQARQFVVHGYVKVNGKKMVYPGYMLNPGDLFQVEPERVLYATGAPKEGKERRAGRRLRRAAAQPQTEAAPGAAEDAAPDAAAAEGDRGEATSREDEDDSAQLDPAEQAQRQRAKLDRLLTAAQAILTPPKKDGPTHRQRLAEFQSRARVHARSMPGDATDDERLVAIANKFAVPLISGHSPPSDSASPDAPSSDAAVVAADAPAAAAPAAATSTPDGAPSAPASAAAPTTIEAAAALDAEAAAAQLATHLDTILGPERARPARAVPQTFATEALRTLRAALAAARENPVDASRPYATPWRPRPWLPAFAFVPRYLEVHPRVCAAVYLRHPVARAGRCEVPSPWGEEVSGLAFNWYLRRR